jgi:hypothetical protein
MTLPCPKPAKKHRRTDKIQQRVLTPAESRFTIVYEPLFGW